MENINRKENEMSSLRCPFCQKDMQVEPLTQKKIRCINPICPAVLYEYPIKMFSKLVLPIDALRVILEQNDESYLLIDKENTRLKDSIIKFKEQYDEVEWGCLAELTIDGLVYTLSGEEIE